MAAHTLPKRWALLGVALVVLVTLASGCSRDAVDSNASSAAAKDEAPAFVTAPTSPSEKGQPLPRLSSMPTDTIGALEPGGSVAVDDEYRVEYSPFGALPSERPSLVVRVLTAEAAKSVSKPLKLADSNLIVELPEDAEGLDVGGRYRATLRFVERSGLLVGQLSEVEALP